MAAAILDRVLERGRFIGLDGLSGRTRHLNLEEMLPACAAGAGISGISDKTIQAILRHASLMVTMTAYVKEVPAASVEAMHR